MLLTDELLRQSESKQRNLEQGLSPNRSNQKKKKKNIGTLESRQMTSKSSPTKHHDCKAKDKEVK